MGRKARPDTPTSTLTLKLRHFSARREASTLLRGPEGPEPALGSLGAASCFVVSREIHFHADIAPASRPSCPPGRRAVSTLTDDLEA